MPSETSLNYARTPVVPTISKTRSPKFSHLLFEFHEADGKVYLIDESVLDRHAMTLQATCIAEHCDTQGRFIGFVQTYLRGYTAGTIKGKSDCKLTH